MFKKCNLRFLVLAAIVGPLFACAGSGEDTETNSNTIATTNTNQIAIDNTTTDTTPQDGIAPSKPSNLQATSVTASFVQLQWSASTDNVLVSGYRVYRDAVLLGTVTQTAFLDTQVSENTAYKYSVVAFDSANNTNISSILSINTPHETVADNTDTTNPTAPGNLRTASSPTESTVSLTWNASTDNVAVSGYRIYRNNSLINTTTSTSYTDSSVSADSTYSYVVRAFDNANNSTASNTLSVNTPAPADTSSPTAPGNLRTSSSPTVSTVNLAWDASTDNVAVSGYRIYRNNSLINTTTSTSYTDSSVSADSTYSYVVRAFDAADNSTASNTLSVNTPAPADTTDPTTPTGLVTTSNTSNSVSISWDASSDNVAVTRYYVYRDSNQIGNVTTRTFTDITVQPGVSYEYRVAAADAAGNTSAMSSILNVTSADNQQTSDTTYYMSPTGSGTECSLSNPCGTFANAFNAMSGGDTLIVMDGTYTQSFGTWEWANGIETSTSNPPSGTSNNPTVIKAQNDGEVIVYGNATDLFLDASYIEIEGFSFISQSGGVASILGNNNTIKRTSFQGNDVNSEAPLVSILGDNNLLEDCWAFGSGKSGITIGMLYNYSGWNNTLRRVVVRMDNYFGDLGFVGVLLYQANNVTLDNVIVLDFGQSTTTFGFSGGIRSRSGDGSNHKFYGTMVLNNPYDGIISSTTSCENCLIWNVDGRGIWQEKYSAGLFNKTTIGNSNTGAQVYDNTFTNTLLYNSGGSNNIGGQYNHYYLSSSSSYGSNYLTDNPLLQYVTRIESGTSGYQSGLNGETRGAEIINRYENGVITNQPLWPFPNEDRIKRDMCNSTYLASAGRTGSDLPGMCEESSGLYGGPITLTSYIWETLGNACPAEYCTN